MTGVVNQTGARSGIIGTIVGTPAGGTGGKVVQVLNYLDNTRQSGFIQTWGSVVSGAITMTHADNEIFAFLHTNFVQNADAAVGMRLYRGSTVIGSAGQYVDALSLGWTNTNAYNPQNLSGSAKDTPGSGTHTYYVKVCGWNQTSSLPVWIGGTDADGDRFWTGGQKGASSLTLMEVSA